MNRFAFALVLLVATPAAAGLVACTTTVETATRGGPVIAAPEIITITCT